MADVLNPNADAQYVASGDRRAAVATAQDQIARIEMLPANEKNVALGRLGLDAGGYAQYKTAAGWPLMPDDKQALEAQREQVEGKAPEIQPSNVVGDVTHAIVGKNVEKVTGSPLAGKIADIATDLIPAALGLKTALGADAAGAEGAAGAAETVEEGAAEPAAVAESTAATPTPEPTADEGAQAPVEPAQATKPEGEIGAPKEAPESGGGTAAPGVPSTAAGHSDAAAIANAAANPMSKEEFEKIEFTSDAEHPDLVTPLSWADRFRAMEYGGQLADNSVVARRRFMATGADEDKAAVDEADAALNEALPRAYAIRHETGLALQKLGASPGAMQLKDVFEAMADNESTPNRLSAMLANLPTMEERGKMLDDAANLTPGNWSAKEAFYNLFVNTRLSLNSVGKKAVSDLANIVWQVPARGLAEIGSRAYELGTGADYGSVGVAPGETSAIVSGMMDNWSSALKLGLDSAREGKPMFEGDVGFLDNPSLANRMNAGVMQGSGFENSWWGRAIDYYGHLVSIPGRSIVGVDQFAKSMQYNMELSTLVQRTAYNEAAADGLEGDELSNRIAELTDQYTEKTPGWMTDQAMNTAKVNTFQEDLQGRLAKIDAYAAVELLLADDGAVFQDAHEYHLAGDTAVAVRAAVADGAGDGWRRRSGRGDCAVEGGAGIGDICLLYRQGAQGPDDRRDTGESERDDARRLAARQSAVLAEGRGRQLL